MITNKLSRPPRRGGYGQGTGVCPKCLHTTNSYYCPICAVQTFDANVNAPKGSKNGFKQFVKDIKGKYHSMLAKFQANPVKDWLDPSIDLNPTPYVRQSFLALCVSQKAYVSGMVVLDGNEISDDLVGPDNKSTWFRVSMPSKNTHGNARFSCHIVLYNGITLRDVYRWSEWPEVQQRPEIAKNRRRPTSWEKRWLDRMVREYVAQNSEK